MNETIEQYVADILTKNKKTLSVAESCTGGLISSLLTDIAGSSEFIDINFVTYSNEAKQKYLGVNPMVLELNGAVSEEVAKEMALGLVRKTTSSFGLSTTGIAGPTGDSLTKPIGLVYIGIADKNKDKAIAYKYNANQYLSRTEIKYDFAKQALSLLYEYLLENIE